MYSRKLKSTVIAILLVASIIMTTGYAAVSQKLTIKGTSKVGSTWSVKITNITSTPTGSATNKSTPRYTDTTATFSTDLVNPGDMMVYDIVISNNGTLDAVLSSVILSDTENEAISFNYSGLNQGDTLRHGTSEIIKVTVKYNDVESQPQNTTSKLEISLNFVQSDLAVIDISSTSCFDFDETSGTITNYNTGCGTDVTIPGTINNIDVREIGYQAFYNKGITSVNIPDSITYIGAESFYHNEISTLTIPNSVTFIDDYAFSDNNLTELELSNTLSKIGYTAFSNNELTNVTIPESVRHIGGQAFHSNKLEMVEIPSNVEDIGYGVFAHNNLTSISLPTSIIDIPEEAFAYNKLTNITIPDSITTIGEKAFSNNLLSSLEIPSNVKSIGSRAFNDNQLPDDQAFIFSRNNGTIDNTILVSYGGVNRDNIQIPETVSELGKESLADNMLTNLTLPNTITKIGPSAIYGNKLEMVEIPESVTEIGSDAFGDNVLTSITIGSNVKTIGRYAFGVNNESNKNLNTIINKTGKSFDWGLVINNYSDTNHTFIIGEVPTTIDTTITIKDN